MAHDTPRCWWHFAQGVNGAVTGLKCLADGVWQLLPQSPCVG